MIVESGPENPSRLPVINPSELARLWREHAATLELIARGRCGAPEDCVQQAFIRLARQQQSIADPVAWLVRVVRNLATDQVRSDQRRREHEQAFAEMYVRAQHGKTVQLEWDEQDLARALLTLPDEQRELIVARIWGQLTFRQLADAFQLSSSAAHRLYSDALGRLRQTLEADHLETGQLETDRLETDRLEAGQLEADCKNSSAACLPDDAGERR